MITARISIGPTTGQTGGRLRRASRWEKVADGAMSRPVGMPSRCLQFAPVTCRIRRAALIKLVLEKE